MLIQVALPVPLYQVFDYQCPEHEALPKIGSRVQVPFGRQTLIGIVVAHITDNQSTIKYSKLKAFQQCLDKEGLLDEKLMALAHWLSRYYHYPLGDVFAVMLPTLIRQGKPMDMLISHWHIVPKIDESVLEAKATKQKQYLTMLKLHGEQGASEEVLLLEGMERPFLRKLQEKGLVQQVLKPKPPPSPVHLAQLPLHLNQEQSQAVNAVLHASAKGIYQGFLLNGITGSGKTEVYLQVMEQVLKAGKQVLILVPEIGLTPQTRARFASRFVGEIVLLHSGMNSTSRMKGWQDCHTGHAQIIIGTRSALLYSFANLGLIVVDEAHDLSYKQQDTLRYHATDVALYRGYQLGIPVILGTATPTLEQLKLVSDGKLTECKLSKRAGTSTTASFKLIDARTHSFHQQAQTDGKLHQAGLTQPLIQAMRETLENGKQVLVFLNRRGYAPILLCEACGWQADCPRCDAHLTVHQNSINPQNPSYLKCHHCDWQSPLPFTCPECGSQNLDTMGVGTTKLSEHLHAIFANPQTSKKTYPIIQIDRDTTRKKNSWEDIYQRIQQGNPAILVGTQMVAKGHHFPNVTLVVLPNADRGFFSANFRSPEHTAQLIIQVAGRAGRGAEQGLVLIQTLQPDNPLLLQLVKEGYDAFANSLLQQRQLLALPPYRHAALIRCEGKQLKSVMAALNEARVLLQQMTPSEHQITIFSPVEAPMTKKNSRYHAQLLLLSQNRAHLHHILNMGWQSVLALPSTKYLKLTLDIDPVSW